MDLNSGAEAYSTNFWTLSSDLDILGLHFSESSSSAYLLTNIAGFLAIDRLAVDDESLTNVALFSSSVAYDFSKNVGFAGLTVALDTNIFLSSGWTDDDQLVLKASLTSTPSTPEADPEDSSGADAGQDD